MRNHALYPRVTPASSAGAFSGLSIAARDLTNLLQPLPGLPLHYDVSGYPGYRYIPYWMIGNEKFSCFPIVEADQ